MQYIHFMKPTALLPQPQSTVNNNASNAPPVIPPAQMAKGLKGTYGSLPLVFLTGFRYFLYQVATQLSSRGWVDPVLDPILPEKFLGYSQESNPRPLGCQMC